MAKLEIDFNEDFFKALGKAADVDRLAPKLIDAALPILRNRVKTAYGAFTVARDISIVKTKKANGGGYVGTVTPAGETGHYYRKIPKNVKGPVKHDHYRYPLSNGGLAVFLEFGVKAHGNFPALPAGGYMARAVAASQDDVQAKMQETYEKETEALKL